MRMPSIRDIVFYLEVAVCSPLIIPGFICLVISTNISSWRGRRKADAIRRGG